MMRSGVTRVGGGGQDSHPGGSMLGQLPAASGGFPPTTGAMPPAPSHPIYVQAPSAIYTSPEIGEAPPPRLQHDQATATAAPAALAHPYAHAQAHAHMMQAAAPHLYHHHRHQQPPAAAAAAAAMGSGYQSVYPHHRHPHHPSVMAAYPPHAQLMMGGAVPPGAMPLVPCAWPGPPAQAAPASPVAASATGFYHLDGSVPAAAAVASAPAPSWSRSAEGKAVPAVDGAAATAETAAGAGAGAGDVPKRRYRGKGKKAPLPVEARAERRKEKSRMYSAIARRRQEGVSGALLCLWLCGLSVAVARVMWFGPHLAPRLSTITDLRTPPTP